MGIVIHKPNFLKGNNVNVKLVKEGKASEVSLAILIPKGIKLQNYFLSLHVIFFSIIQPFNPCFKKKITSVLCMTFQFSILCCLGD